MAHLTCPACGLSLQARFSSLSVQYCPRCLARRALVELTLAEHAVVQHRSAEHDPPDPEPRRPPSRQRCCLRVGTRTVGDIALIELAGELDLSGVAPMQQAVSAAVSGVAGLVVIDLGELAFTDACGLRALIDAERRLGGRLRLLPAHGAVARVLEITGLVELLPFAFNGPLIPTAAPPDGPGGTDATRRAAQPARRTNTNRNWEWNAIRRRVR